MEKSKTLGLAEAFAAAEKADKEAKKGGKGNRPVQDLEVAFTVLMVDMAACDQNFTQEEYGIIAAGLKRIFGTSKDKVQGLVNQANTIIATLRGTSRYAAILRDNLTNAEKKAVMETLDELVMSDGEEDGFEKYLRTKLSDLLDIPADLSTEALDE